VGDLPDLAIAPPSRPQNGAASKRGLSLRGAFNLVLEFAEQVGAIDDAVPPNLPAAAARCLENREARGTCRRVRSCPKIWSSPDQQKQFHDITTGSWDRGRALSTDNQRCLRRRPCCPSRCRQSSPWSHRSERLGALVRERMRLTHVIRPGQHATNAENTRMTPD
jgi:hypothetical protein